MHTKMWEMLFSHESLLVTSLKREQSRLLLFHRVSSPCSFNQLEVTFTCTRQEYGTCIPCVHFNVVFCLQGDFSIPGGGNRLRERLGPHKVRGVDTRGPRGQTPYRPGYAQSFLSREFIS